MKSKTVKLKENNYDFVVFAIVSAEDDSYLVWNINNILMLDLKRTEHPVLKNRISDGKTVSCFNYMCNNTGIEYLFIGNKYGELELFPQLSNVDFILKISGNLTNECIKHIAVAIRTVKGITACINLNVKKTPLFDVFGKI
ncbi:MAG: IPExxxVDY family protein [Prevotellaceae bacterium]|jgi:hypothetical protein|nr:IPExxxVDY family protein [Prevotellaceae bacterium]